MGKRHFKVGDRVEFEDHDPHGKPYKKQGIVKVYRYPDFYVDGYIEVVDERGDRILFGNAGDDIKKVSRLRPGKFITFEGVEGCGKSTQLAKLCDWLKSDNYKVVATNYKYKVVATREPGGTELGLGLRKLLLEPGASIQERAELLLYAADRAQHVEEMLKPSLAKGKIVLCDRYTDSTIAYQGYGRQINLSLISQINQIATDGLESDLTFWLDIDVEEGLRRKRQQGELTRIEKADLAFHRRVQQGFTELAASNPDRIVRIDASLSIDSIAQQIQAVMLDRLNQWYSIDIVETLVRTTLVIQEIQ